MPAETRPQTIGLFGGSFNPPHLAHVLVVGWALAGGEVDEVWVIPTGGHPFGKPLAPFADRLAMARLAFECYGDRVCVRDVESEDRVHYSVNTVKSLSNENPALNWRWIVGSDTLEQTGGWRDFEGLVRVAPPLVIPRMGHPARWNNADKNVEAIEDANFALPDLSSTFVRGALAEGREDGLGGLVPAKALAYIRERGLYEQSE